ncbi:extracellular solute-binding protein [Hoeflea sp. G2-23]|uniref:Putrescine-binding periplasmic protein n=1 Tax=Hoeflea algicola TaxID=2983763 RepID=A0ABT3ZEB1_9HYPH|nr:extracellular solute-binding protein [Hoeflea algicola]MCY0150135.1 extracellular solute-binding protein [Hoeflea algicola]
MRHFLKAGYVAIAACMLPTLPAHAEGALAIFNWGDYISDEMVKKFEAKYDVKVTVDTYDSNETMLAKLQSGISGYDLAVPGDYMVEILIQEGLIEKVEPNTFENYGNLEPKWADVYWDPGRHYSVPWVWGTTSFTVSTKVYKGDVDTLAVMFDPPEELRGRINLLRDVNDVINAALRYLDLPRCNETPEDLKKVQALLADLKPSVKSFAYESKELAESGEVDLAQIWNGKAYIARQGRPELQYAYPKEGYTGWMDNLVVVKGAPNLENAKLFMNFLMDPENAAMMTNFTGYPNGVLGSEKFVNADLRDSHEYRPPEGAPDPEFVKVCNETVIKLYDRVWTNFLK